MRLERKASLLFLISLALYLTLSLVVSIGLTSWDLLDNKNAVYAASALFVSVPAFLIPALIFRGKNRSEMERFRAPRFSHIMIAVALGYGCVQLSGALSYLNEAIFYGVEIKSNSTTAQDLLSVNGFIMFFAVAVLPPLTEEFIMRGTLLESWRRTSPVWAAVLTSALFAFLHLAPSSFIVYFGMGMMFALVYLITRNVWLTVIMHFVNNLYAVLAALFLKAFPEALEGAESAIAEADAYSQLLDSRLGSLMKFFTYAAIAAAILVPMTLLLRSIYRRNHLGMYKVEPAVEADPIEAEPEPVYLPGEKKPSLFADPVLWVVLAILVVLNVIYGLSEFGVIGAD